MSDTRTRLDIVLEVYRDTFAIRSERANDTHRDACIEVDRLRKQAARIASLEAALEATQKEAFFLAQIWRTYREEFGSIVDGIGGDPDGITFVAEHVVDQETDRVALVTGEPKIT